MKTSLLTLLFCGLSYWSSALSSFGDTTIHTSAGQSLIAWFRDGDTTYSLMYKDLNYPEGAVYASVRFSNGNDVLQFLEHAEACFQDNSKKRTYDYEIIPLQDNKLKVTSGGETYTEIDAIFIAEYRQAFLSFLNTSD
jgi:hypothetical protein